VVATILGQEIIWATEEFREFAKRRLNDRADGKADPIATVFEAAIAARLAMTFASTENLELAAAYLSRAVEELPGNQRLMHAETSFQSGGTLELDLHGLIFGVPISESDDSASFPVRRRTVVT
jgi:hypothetical protein